MYKYTKEYLSTIIVFLAFGIWLKMNIGEMVDYQPYILEADAVVLNLSLKKGDRLMSRHDFSNQQRLICILTQQKIINAPYKAIDPEIKISSAEPVVSIGMKGITSKTLVALGRHALYRVFKFELYDGEDLIITISNRTNESKPDLVCTADGLHTLNKILLGFSASMRKSGVKPQYNQIKLGELEVMLMSYIMGGYHRGFVTFAEYALHKITKHLNTKGG